MPAWTQRYRFHTYWDGPERIGFVSASTEPVEPAFYLASYQVTDHERVQRVFRSLDDAKRWVERRDAATRTMTADTTIYGTES
jgi:hypothetical protein